jgi:hypothetical protein
MRGWDCRLQLLLPSPAQSFSGPGPADIMTIFPCFRFETPQPGRPGPRTYIPPGTGWSSYIPRHCVLFSLPPTYRRAKVGYSNPPPLVPLSTELSPLLITSRQGPHRKTPVFTVVVQLLPSSGNVFTEPLPETVAVYRATA